MLTDPVDIESLYDAMVSCKAAFDYGFITKKEMEEDIWAIKQLKDRAIADLLKERRILGKGKRDSEDSWDAKDHRT